MVQYMPLKSVLLDLVLTFVIKSWNQHMQHF